MSAARRRVRGLPGVRSERVDTAAIRERWSKVMPGPWFWFGNTDMHSVSLAGRVPGLGVCEVLTTRPVRRDPDGREAQNMRSDMAEMDYTPEQIAVAVYDWAFDENGEPRTDERLVLSDRQGHLYSAEHHAVYQVARAQGLPDDTPRDHPAVYRADIVDVRLDSARALAHAWSDVHDLLAENERLRARIARLESYGG